jgi:hypothetical protein
MYSNTSLFIIGALCVGAPVLFAVAIYVVVMRSRASALQKKIDAVNGAIIDYFRKIEIKVEVNCAPATGTDRLIVLIESEPMKQMRLSHIIETSLRDLVHNLHRIELDKIYWRFPLKNRPASADQPKEKKPGDDDYITEGLRHLPPAEVTEASWEHFEQASTRGPNPQQ